MGRKSVMGPGIVEVSLVRYERSLEYGKVGVDDPPLPMVETEGGFCPGSKFGRTWKSCLPPFLNEEAHREVRATSLGTVISLSRRMRDEGWGRLRKWLSFLLVRKGIRG